MPKKDKKCSKAPKPAAALPEQKKAPAQTPNKVEERKGKKGKPTGHKKERS